MKTISTKWWVSLGTTLVLVLFLWLVSTSLGQEPVGSQINYQGTLLLNGEPVDGAQDMTFRVHTDDACTVQIGSDIVKNGVVVSNGWFSANLDVEQSDFHGQALWLEVEVDGTVIGCQEILPAPYALSLRPGAIISGTNGSNNFGQAPLNIEHEGGGPGLYVRTNEGTAIYGSSNGSYQWETKAAVQGKNWASGPYGIGGDFYSRNGTGLYGESSAPPYTTAPYGVYGYATGGYGVFGKTTSSNSSVAAIKGLNTKDGYAAYFESLGGTGVYGTSTGTDKNTNFGGSFYSKNGVGLKGYSTAPMPTPGPDASGVYGYSKGGSGVYGQSASSASASAGVWGEATWAGYGVYGYTYASDRAGVFAANDNSESPDLVLGGSSGILASDGDSSSSQLVLRSNDNVHILLDSDNGSTSAQFRIDTNTSSVDTNTLFEVTESGNVYADGGFNCGVSNGIQETNLGGTGVFALQESGINKCLSDSNPADFAEMLPVSDAGPLGPGDVLVIDLDGRLERSSEAYQANVVGVYSLRPSYLGNARYADDEGYAPLALVGMVPVKASAEAGPIQPGDLLTASSLPGHAMRCEGVEACFGRTIGKALGALAEGTGAIQMLVILQ